MTPSSGGEYWENVAFGTNHAVLIGIEAYQRQGISSVKYALAHSAAMKEVPVQHMGVALENINL